ncbi:hypothetical protein H4R18_005526 [Coemansia javaensis]|uniref:Uncharacterized protein n=1 Tax=Coemansia javaensis TaxID=2761396 RepID=A0A9W8LE57_9FUNG|nr:hypothetical protein H4R18_005526 [Coemansia javaensis]
MKIVLFTTAAAVCALAAGVHALPDGVGAGAKAGATISQAGDLKSLDPRCTMADGKTAMSYYPGGDFALLSNKYMGGAHAGTYCGLCINAAGARGHPVRLTVVGACDGCTGDGLATGEGTFAALGGKGAAIAGASWAFVDCWKPVGAP